MFFYIISFAADKITNKLWSLTEAWPPLQVEYFSRCKDNIAVCKDCKRVCKLSNEENR